MSTLMTQAQDLESILLAAKGDANKLTEAYISPAMKGLIYGMNSGWYHTAKVHKKLGFDIAIGLNVSMVPSEDEIFTISNLESVNLPSGTVTSSTVAGSRDGAMLNVSTEVEVNGSTQTATTTFQMPSGISEDLPLNAVPTPAVQLSVGLPYKIDVMARFVPEVGDEDVKGSLIGFGFKKEITSIFGTLDRLPLHVSLLGAYTNMKVNYKMNESAIAGSNQNAKFKLNSYTVQAIGSLNFPIINIYGGIGYSAGSSNLRMLGQYDLEYDGNVSVTLDDPINLDFDASGFRTTIGARLSLGFFKIFADYTLQEYNTISGGIAFSFR